MNTTYRKLTLTVLIVLTVLLIGVPVYAAPVGNLSEDDLVAQWNFDETSGSTVYDSLGNYNGTANGAPVITENNDKFRRFNGTTDFISFNNPIIPIGEKSIKLRFRKDTIPAADAWNTILSTCISDFGDGFLAAIAPSNSDYSGKIYFQFYKDGAQFAMISPYSVCDGKWHEVMFTWTGDTTKNGLKLYIDDMTTPIKETTALFTESNTRKNLNIGKPAYANKFYFKGDLDKVEIYDKCYIPAPQNLTAVPGDARVTLTWDAVGGATGYNVKRAITLGGPYETVVSAVYGTSYTDSPLVNGTTYYYVVSAINAAGESGPSNEVSATPKAEDQPSSGKIMLKTDDGLIYSGDLVGQTSEIFRLKNVYLFNGIPSFTSINQPTYDWEISFFKNKVIWFYFDK